MKIDYDKLVPPASLKSFSCEIVNGVPEKVLNPGWNAVMVYHPATKQYYATTSQDPMQYERILRIGLEPRYSRLAVALRSLMAINKEFQLFVFHMSGRYDFERWLEANGVKRVATKMGEGDNPNRILFKVFSPRDNFTRYVSAMLGTPRDNIIDQANRALAAWLNSTSSQHKAERLSMRVALRSKGKTTAGVFDEHSEVTPTNTYDTVTPNCYRSVCMAHNYQSVKDFIRRTCTG